MMDGRDLQPSTGYRLPAILATLAGLLGACGVGLSAAAAHRGGGELGTTAGLFCLMHAGALLGLGALSAAVGRAARLTGVGGVLLGLGCILFAGDLAAAAFLGARPFPPAAPIGGGLLLVGWILVAAGGLRLAAKPSARP